MSKNKHHHHFLDIYNLSVHVAVTRKQMRHAEKYLKQNLRGPIKRRAAGATFAIRAKRDGAETFHVYFWIDKKMWKKAGGYHSKLAEICAHEAAHGAGMIWNETNATMDHDTLRDDEPMPYLIGWLTELLVRKVLK